MTIVPPKIEEMNISISKKALGQIFLIKENDYTLEDQVFRLQIDGKGCGGFDYAMGFGKAHDDDLILNYDFDGITITLHVDPFTAYYCQTGELDYLREDLTFDEGFVFTNANEKNYRGKFFKDETKVPKLQV